MDIINPLRDIERAWLDSPKWQALLLQSASVPKREEFGSR